MIKEVLQNVQEKQVVAVAPHYNGVHSSIVYTHQGVLSLVETVEEVMNEICYYFCSDLQGRINGTRKRFHFIKKPPILISESLGLVAFPLPSELRGESMWLFNNDFKIEVISSSKSKVTFGPHLSFDIPTSRQSIINQQVRAIQILHAFTYANHVPPKSTFPASIKYHETKK